MVANWPEADTERTVAKPAEPPRWPLTGLEAPSAEAITQRVVSVKIENSAEARPQTNLQLADVVYESVTEGGITRFNAIFHSQAPEVVGPVRSRAPLRHLHRAAVPRAVRLLGRELDRERGGERRATSRT